jgi:hypothetical protein
MNKKVNSLWMKKTFPYLITKVLLTLKRDYYVSKIINVTY